MTAPQVAARRVLEEAAALRSGLPDDLYAQSIEAVYHRARTIAVACVDEVGARPRSGPQVIDRILTHRVAGFLAMGILLYGVFWVTISGSAGPSRFLFWLLVERGHPVVVSVLSWAHLPGWSTGLLADGAYVGTAWVVAVMLPPMAIFFPLFALLEDVGYLPRVAFNLDRLFAGAGAHGKQALTMMVGFGCNAAGVTAARIIESPRERLIAIITNNFSICNGRWPTLILMGTIFLGSVAPAGFAGAVAAGSVVATAVLGIGFALLVSWGLSRTVLKGEASFYALELPAYRRPQVWRTLVRTLHDRTLKVLWRAIVMAAPAGALIWLLTHVDLGGEALSTYLVDVFDPVGLAIGLNGVVLVAYVLAIPANEIVVPTILLLTLQVASASGAPVLPNASGHETAAVLVGVGGWTVLTGINLMLFSMLHNPCSTTILTIFKETGSVRWTLVATLLPLALAFAVTWLTATIAHLTGFSN